MQISVCKLLDHYNLVWFHPPNEAKRSHYVSYLIKQKGLKAGVPDILIFNRHGDYFGTAIELKIGNKKLTENQIEWEGKLLRCNWSYHVCRSIDDVIVVLKKNYNI